jgi:biopolymer transport protein ExbD
MAFGRKRLAYYGVVFGALIFWFAWRALHPDEITLRLHRGGAIDINGRTLALDDVVRRLQALDASSPRKVVTIDADGDVPASQLVELVDRVHQAGAADVQFQTQP